LDAEDRRLERVESFAVADLIVFVLARPTVIAQLAHSLEDCRVATRDGPGVAVGPEVLRREEAEATCDTDGPHATASIAGPVCLGRVLDDNEAVSIGDLEKLVHRGRAAVEMDREDRFGPRR